MIYFTSDLHFSHHNVIKYCNRPFTDVDHMNMTMVSNFNATVAPEDITYIIGDFAMGIKSLIPSYRAQLNGKIILVVGNHDRHRKTNEILTEILAAGFDEIHEEVYVTIDSIPVYLRHEPKMDWVADDRSQYHLHGHVHQAFNRKGSLINVGVDVRSFKPWSLQELVADTVEVSGPSH